MRCSNGYPKRANATFTAGNGDGVLIAIVQKFAALSNNCELKLVCSNVRNSIIAAGSGKHTAIMEKVFELRMPSACGSFVSYIVCAGHLTVGIVFSSYH